MASKRRRGRLTGRTKGGMKTKVIRSCISRREPRKKTVTYDKRRYKWHKHIEIMFGRSKD
ncbi:hypothetical protein GCM10007385_01360 [Tateyamaria omphalii]|nr:hypothetical protein GCM10007385_01360 [Tateyamaria omphalii]